MSRKQLIVERAIQQILEAFPNVIAIRILDSNGLPLSNYDYDADLDKIPRLDSPDAIAPLTGATSTLLERICYELSLGEEKFTYLLGDNRTFFVFKIGIEDAYMMSLLFEGTPSVDTLSVYFQKHDWLWHIIPFINIPQK